MSLDPFTKIAALEQQIADLTKLVSQRETDLSSTRKEVRRHTLTGKSVEGVVRSETEILVPRHLVRGNAAEYQRFKQLAAQDGLEMRIIENEPFEEAKPMPERFENDRTVYIARPVLSGRGDLYQEEKRLAERNGKRLIICDTASNFPVEAFEESK